MWHRWYGWFLESPRRLYAATILALLSLSLFYFGINPWIWNHDVQLGIQVIETQKTDAINNSPFVDSEKISTTPHRSKADGGLLVTQVTGPKRRHHSLSSDVFDSKALQLNFPKLKIVAKQHIGRYHSRLDQMMLSYLPLLDTSAWIPHSPSGKKFTFDEIHSVAKSTIQPGFLVPNVAHFVLPFSDTNLQFHHMVSLLSCLHVMKPHRLLLWYTPGKLPTGQWWDRVKNNLTESEWEERIIFVQRPIPTSVYTVPVHGKEHQSDVMRMEAVLTFGGVYMDIDVLVLKPLEPLRKFPFTIGREVSYGLCNGIFMSAPNGTFLAMWHTAYQVFNDEAWGDHSVKLPSTMHAAFPDLCHVEEESMDRPNWTVEERNWIYGIGQQRRWDWRTKNYAMHLWFRLYNRQHNMDNIKTLNSMYGEMCRYILYGSS